VFQGAAHLSLDSKGRLAVPARHREALLARCAGRLVITADYDKCLLVYPQPDWEPIRQTLMSKSNLNPRIRELQRHLIGYAEDIEIDAAGRVLISPVLRDFAALEKNVVLVGQGHRFELWDKEKWQQMLDSSSKFSEENLPPELEGFSL
jgi:MraZ protein